MRTMCVLLPALLAFLVGASPAHAWTWPVDGPVLQAFLFGDDPYAAGQHRGIDIGAPSGSPVRAPAGGTVSFAGTVPAGGRTLTIRTGDGYAVTLLHLGTVVPRRGESVDEGDIVGTIGPTGEVEHDESYVHLGIRVASQPEGYVDPLSLLPKRGTIAAAEEPALPRAHETPADPEPTGGEAEAADPAEPVTIGRPGEAAGPAAAPAGPAADAEPAATTVGSAEAADEPSAEPVPGLAIRVASDPEGHVDPLSVTAPAPDVTAVEPSVPAGEPAATPPEPDATLIEPAVPGADADPVEVQAADGPRPVEVPAETAAAHVPAETGAAAAEAAATPTDGSSGTPEAGEPPRAPEVPADRPLAEPPIPVAPFDLPFVEPTVPEAPGTSAESQPPADALGPRPQADIPVFDTETADSVARGIVVTAAVGSAQEAAPDAEPGGPAPSTDNSARPDGAAPSEPTAEGEPVAARSHPDPSAASAAAVAADAPAASSARRRIERRSPVAGQPHVPKSTERAARPGVSRRMTPSRLLTAVPPAESIIAPAALAPAAGAARLARTDAAGEVDAPAGRPTDGEARAATGTADARRHVGVIAVLVGAFSLLAAGTTVAFVWRRAQRLPETDGAFASLVGTGTAEEPPIDPMRQPPCGHVREEKRRRGGTRVSRPAASNRRGRGGRQPRRVPVGMR